MRATELFALMCFNAVRAPYRLDPVEQQSDGEHDFDILSPDGLRVGVLEVTSTTNSRYQGTLEALHPSRGGGLVPKSVCRHEWRVWPTPHASVKTLRAHLDWHLAAVEAAGFSEFDDKLDHASVRAITGALRVASGRVTDDVPGHHVINLPGLSESVHPQALPDAVQAEASKLDNLAKLADRTVSERHLFVCVDMSTLAAFWQVDAGYPIPAVTVDDSITHIWAAKQMGAFWGVVLHATNGGEWEKTTVSWSAADEPPVT